MNRWQKIGVVAGVAVSAVTATHMINKFIFAASASDKLTDINERSIYRWKFGDIAYSKAGNGSPLLLIHDLNVLSSSYEWSKVYNELCKNHTVYAIDLTGCGYSSRPAITYTAYFYVQMLGDFITNIIGHRTDVVVTGDASPSVIMACYNNSSLFNRIVLVNPQGITSSARIPNKQLNLLRSLLALPVIGTSIYNSFVSRSSIAHICKDKLFYNSSRICPDYINALHENAHLGGAASRYLLASTEGHYTTVSIARALASIDNSIFIIAGADANNCKSILNEYIIANPAIETVLIPRSRHLPQLERPSRFIKQLEIFLS